MNKTIIININGTIFHIEEDAYEVLKNYMTEVKRHFYNSADSLEITTDIENRIAEMFTEVLAREHRQVIVEQDVKTITGQMGSVQDFDYEEAGTVPPASAYTESGHRRLFRDADDHLIGGVCAGIASYFDIQVVWARLLFAIFTAFAGTGLFLYIILWIIIPKAVTRADRMAMKGEPLDLQGFKRNFEAELNSVGGRLSAMHQEARPLIYRTRDFAGDFFGHLGKSLTVGARLLLKVLGGVLIVSFASSIVAVLVVLVLALVLNQYHFDLPINFFEYQYIKQVYVAVSLVAILPMVGLITLIARTAFHTRTYNSTVGYTLLTVWLVALSVLVYHGSRAAAELSDSASLTQTINLKPVASQTYHLKLNDLMYLTAADSARLDIKNRFKNLTVTNDMDDDSQPRSVNIEIVKADVNYPVLIENFTARGRDYDHALMNARNSRYIFSQQDSVLKFDYKIRREKHELWHGEEVKLTLQIPLNATVVIDDEINKYIDNYLNIYRCNVELNHKKEATTAAFTMTDNGLECKTDSLTIRILNQQDSIRQGQTQF